MYYSTLLPLLASLGVSLGAIVPVSPGQIGINPVVLTEYLATNTQYFSYVSSTASWIGADSVIVETVTMTVNNAPVTTTSTALIAVRTATAEADGNSPGDISFVVTPAGSKELDGVFQEATNSCAKSNRKRGAGGLPCEVQYLADLITAGVGLLGGLDDGGAIWKAPGSAIAGGIGADFLLGVGAVAFEGIALGAALGGLAYEAWYLYGPNSNTYRFKVVEIELPKQGQPAATTTAEALPPYFTNYIAERVNYVPFNPDRASALASYWQSFFGENNLLPPGATTEPPAPTNTAIKLTCATSGPAFGRDVVLAKATEFCSNAISNGWSSTLLGGIDSTNSNPFSAGSQKQDFFDVIPNQANYALRFNVQVLKSGEACNPGSTVALDFVALGQDKCVWDLMNAIDGCPSLQGGTTLADCAQWDVNSIAGLG